jgi:hypothetical protein
MDGVAAPDGSDEDGAQVKAKVAEAGHVTEGMPPGADAGGGGNTVAGRLGVGTWNLRAYGPPPTAASYSDIIAVQLDMQEDQETRGSACCMGFRGILRKGTSHAGTTDHLPLKYGSWFCWQSLQRRAHLPLANSTPIPSARRVGNR